MQINGVEIEDTFAEAFSMVATRLQVTAANKRWAEIVAKEAVGFTTSIIECGCEAGIENEISPEDSLDGRAGYNLLFLAMKEDGLKEELVKRVGQTVMTSPTSACFNGLETEKKIDLGAKLRYFGDGYQISKLYGERRFWRIPVMDGEFIIEESVGIKDAIGGGNFLILGEDQTTVLKAAERAVEVIKKMPGVILPFPGGVVRSGSKVGSKYDFLSAATNTRYCPAIKAQTESDLSEEVGAVLEIVINGLSHKAIAKAIKAGIKAACIEGIVKISAGNYDGNLGSHIFNLTEILGEDNDD